MRYRFVTILHNLNLANKKNKGIDIGEGIRISNDSDTVKEMLNTSLMQYTAGYHSIKEFDDQVCFYLDGEFENVKTDDKANEFASQLTFHFLRTAQWFVNSLWEIKDNSIYVRDGFLLTYEKTLEDGNTYKASLSEIFSSSTGTREAITFTDEEIRQAVSKYVVSAKEDIDFDSFGGRDPSSKHFFKSSNTIRFDRVSYFLALARKSAVTPMKIIFYCSALECLFTVDSTELTHKIAERVAAMMGTTKDEKKEIYQLVKKAYGYRSTIIHGSSLKGKEDELKVISQNVDNILRKIIKENHDIFSEKDSILDNYFVDLLFTK